MCDRLVGVLGASSLVGTCLVPTLGNAGWRVIAFSRQMKASDFDVEWRQLSPSSTFERILYWICVAPIWVLPDYLAWLEACGARRIVALSSTSRFTKVGSDDTAEAAVAVRLIEAEECVQAWAESRGIEWVILRPTLIYGFGHDKNISAMARFIRRFGFFPVLGKATGLRQPIHAKDVAVTCLAALEAPNASNRAYSISGGETLAYREMVARVFAALGLRPRFLTVPLWAFHLAVAMLRYVPRYRQWSAAMAGRMNSDLVFGHTEAAQDLGFEPRQFTLAAEDLPI